MEKSRLPDQRVRTQNALCKSNITQTLDVIAANKGQGSSLLTIVSMAKIKVEIAVWVDAEFISPDHDNVAKEKEKSMCHKHFSLSWPLQPPRS